MDNITLIGMPGSGKSTIGRLVAQHLGYTFLDLDQLMEQAEHVPLQTILDHRGVSAFLALEEAAIRSVSCHRHVLSPGGSAVCSAEAMSHLKQLGLVIYLRVELAELISRIHNLSTRGIAMEPGQTLSQLYHQRTPLYQQYADLIVDCPPGQPPHQTARHLVQLLSCHPAFPMTEQPTPAPGVISSGPEGVSPPHRLG